MNELVIADAGPIISLSLADQLGSLEALFDDVKIPQAVWNEIPTDEHSPLSKKVSRFFADKVRPIEGFNDLA